MLVSRDPDRYRGLTTARGVFQHHVDEIIVTNSNDLEETSRALDELDARHPIRGIMTVTDYQLGIVAELARSRGLPGLDPHAAETCRNKLRMRDKCQALNISPKYAHARNLDDALTAARQWGYPVVAKPMTDSASIGVELCRTQDDLVGAFAHLSEGTTNFRGQSKPPGALIEEYALGPEVSVEVIFHEGRHVVLGVTDKNLGPHPYFIEVGDTFPSILPQSLIEDIEDVSLRALRTVGHNFGSAHVEVRVTPDGPKVIEINGRIPGDEITRMVEHVTGVDMLEATVSLHAGLEATVEPVPQGAVASRYLLAHGTGTLTRISGSDLATQVEGCLEVDFEVSVGDSVDAPTNNLDYIGHVLCSGSTPGLASRRADTAVGQVTFDIDS